MSETQTSRSEGSEDQKGDSARNQKVGGAGELEMKHFLVKLEDLLEKEKPTVVALKAGISRLVSETLKNVGESDALLKRSEDIKKAVRSGFADRMGGLVEDFREGNNEASRELGVLSRVVEVVKFE